MSDTKEGTEVGACGLVVFAVALPIAIGFTFGPIVAMWTVVAEGALLTWGGIWIMGRKTK